MKTFENLGALVHGADLTAYHRALALQEFEQLTNQHKKIEELRSEYNERVTYVSREITTLTTARERMYAAAIKIMCDEFVLKLNKILEEK